MTSKQIEQWCHDRIAMKSTSYCNYSDDFFCHRVKFENGDVYEYEERGHWTDCTNSIKINGKTERVWKTRS